MNVSLIKTPFEVSFTGNPMPFVWALSPYGDPEKLQDIRLQIGIEVEATFMSTTFSEVRSQSFYPDRSGMISIDMQSILDTYVDYYTPRPTLKRPVQALQHRKRYRLSYRMVVNGINDGDVLYSPILYAIKGGLSYEHWHPSEFFTDVVLQQKKPLKYVESKPQLIGRNETRFLFWIFPYLGDPALLIDGNGDFIIDADGSYIIVNEYGTEQSVVFSITTNFGRVVTYPLPVTINCGKWGVCCTPIGFNQLNLQDRLLPGEMAISYTVSVIAGDEVIINPVAFKLDYRQFYRTSELLYRTSLGAFETVRLRGQIDFEADYARQDAQQTVPPNYYKSALLLPQTSTAYTEEQAKYKGDTGFITREAADRLRDLFLSVQKVELINGKYYPVNISVKNAKFFTNKDSLISTIIEWQAAYTNQFYTPQNLMGVTRSCPAVDTFSVTQISKNMLHIMYALPSPYDQVQVQILIEGVTSSYMYYGNSGSVMQSFANNIVGSATITIKGRVVCNEDSDPADFGPFSEVDILISDNQPLVLVDDHFYINAGYTDFTDMAFSVLANDYDPDGGLITLITASGATNAGGQYILYANGSVRYMPPSSSYAGIDYFDYEATEEGSSDTSTARVYIHVGSVSNGVYVKLVTRNLTNGYEPGYLVFEEGERWIDFFSDPAGTVPVDVSSMGLFINVQQNILYQSQDGDTTDTQTLPTFTATGTRIKIYGYILLNWARYENSWNTPETYTVNHLILPGAGYTVI